MVTDRVTAMKWICAKLKFWEGSTGHHKTYDEDMTLQQRVHKHGYKIKSHPVHTEDGFILTVFQIMKPHLSKEDEVNAPVVLMQHGLGDDANTWLRNGKKSPALILAHAGYNVFLGNNRGNRYSRKHLNLDPRKDAKQYFDYSFYEHGKYDVPA